jgi:DNA-directed RNA polymerase specialized sigma24 family protein
MSSVSSDVSACKREQFPLENPPATWQGDFECNLPYYYRFFGKRFYYLNPELREEQVQEGVCQAALIYCRQYEQHGKRVEDRYSIARTVLHRVKRGTQCTRDGCKNADLLDRTDRKSGPKREECRRTVTFALLDAPAWPELPVDCHLDLAAWLAQLPPAHRKIAEQFLAGATTADIANQYGVQVSTAGKWRRELAASFVSWWH